MFRSSTSVLLKDLYSIIIVMSMIKFSLMESILDKTWLNHMQHLTSNYDFDNKTFKSHPLNEGFILLSDNHKKSMKLAVSTNYNPTTYKTTVMVKTTNPTIRFIGHRSRRLLYELNSETNMDKSSVDDNSEIDQFMKVNNVEELTKQLINLDVTIDGSGETTEPTTETTTTRTSTATTTRTSITPPENLTLSGNSTFIVTIDCTNALSILNNISEQLNKTFPYWHVFLHSEIPNPCARSLTIDVTITILTDSNITILNNLFQTLATILSNMGIELKSVDECGTNEIVVVKNVTSCYLINLCNLCGTNPPRGVCLPEKNLSKCECFVNQNNPTITYIDDFCKIPKEEPATSSSSSWPTSIIIGVLAGIAGLFLIIIIFLLVMTIVRRRQLRKQKESIQDSDRLCDTPIRTSVANQNGQKYFDDTHTQTTNQIITRPNTPDILATTYDPIIELDAILDDDESLKILNPNLNLLR